MLNTSQAYKAAIAGRELKHDIEITISDGSNSVTLGNTDIIAESFSINERSSNNSNISLGACYSASLSFTSLTNIETQVVGNILTITPYEIYHVGNNQTERIPLGRFRCEKPIVYSRTTSYECDDFMLSFDAPIESRFSGNGYNIVLYCCNKCGITLGTTQQEFSRFPNYTQIFFIDPDECDSYREVIGYVAAMHGAYCKMGRDGKLYVRQFHATPDMSLPRNRRNSCAFAGYETVFAGVKCRFLAEQNFAPYEYIAPDREGLVVDLGDIPILEETVANKHRLLENIYNSVLSGLAYYPCELEITPDPSIETGDMITTLDREGHEKNTLITAETINFRRLMELKSEGGNPKLEKVTTAEKRAQKREEQDKKNLTIVTSTYVNAAAITVDGDTTPETVTDLKFFTEKDLTAIFGASIPVVSTGEGIVEISYTDGGIIGDVVRARVHEGENLLTLINHLYYPNDSIVNLLVKARTYGIDGGSAPTLTIAQDTVRSYVFAQGMVAETPWDGIIVIDQNVEVVDSILEVNGLTETITVTTFTDVHKGFTTSLDEIAAELQTQSVSGSLEIKLEYGDYILRCGMGHRAGGGRMFDGLRS